MSLNQAKVALLLAVLGWSSLHAQTVESTPQSAPVGPPDTSAKPVPESRSWVTQNQIHIGGALLPYTATAGTLLMKNEKDEPIALFGYTAYVKKGSDVASRPILLPTTVARVLLPSGYTWASLDPGARPWRIWNPILVAPFDWWRTKTPSSIRPTS